MSSSPSPRRGSRVLIVLGGLVLLLSTRFDRLGTHDLARAQAITRPNIVLIVTDDQRPDSLVRMPYVQRLLVDAGMRLDRAIVTDPLCCPSRVTMLTGRYSHSTNVYTSEEPYGGWSRFTASGGETTTIATALHGAGYRTGLIGKYLNGYQNAGAYVPPGWDRWFATVSPRYYGYTVFTDNAGFVTFGSAPEDYLTDVLKIRAKRFVRNTPTEVPLFLMVTPFAPHGPSTPAPRHDGSYADATVELGPAVDEKDVSDKPAYIQARGKTDPARLTSRTIEQWESLLAVDEMVRTIVNTLEETGRIGNTVLIYTSDNGYSNAEHRWNGKQVPYEESVRVPLVVRSDGEIPPGIVSDALVSNVDLAPTIADFAQVTLPGVDGVSLRPLMTDTSSSARDSVVLEFVTPPTSPVPTYCGVRTTRFSFVHYATGEEELYDLGADPWQLQNVAEVRPVKADELRNLTMELCRPVPPGFAW